MPIDTFTDLRIPAGDDITLSAILWRPKGSGLYCLIDMIPYRWRDIVSDRDDTTFPILAETYNFACLRVDVRGTGESGGLLDDEYDMSQQRDLDAIMDWVASQPWSNGRVGVMGNSWGGFSALQAVRTRHPALQAVLVSCASGNNLTDDAHFESGLVLSENFIWGTYLTALAGMPCDPALAEARGEEWASQWKTRLHHLKPFSAHWIKQLKNNAYWAERHFDRRDYPDSSIFLVGGWLDAYARGLYGLMPGNPDTLRVMIGGQAHAYPHKARADLSTDFLPIVADWFGPRKNGHAHTAPDLYWIFTHIPCAADPHAEGLWLTAPNREAVTMNAINDFRLISAPDSEADHPGLTLTFGKWCPGGDGFQENESYPRPPDQDEIRSWVYATPNFTEEKTFLGRTEVELSFSHAFADGAWLLRVFLCGQGQLKKRIGYAVLNKFKGGRFFLSPFGFRVKPGEWLEVHALPQAWPLLWSAPFEAKLDKCPFAALNLPEPLNTKIVQVPMAVKPDGRTDAHDPAHDLHVARKGDKVVLRMHSPAKTFTTRWGAHVTESVQQIFIGRQNGFHKGRITAEIRINWPGSGEEAHVYVKTSVLAKAAGMRVLTHMAAWRNGEPVFTRDIRDVFDASVLG